MTGHCHAHVDEPPHYLHTHYCSRRPSVERRGIPLCTQHAKMARKYPHLLEDWKKAPS